MITGIILGVLVIAVIILGVIISTNKKEFENRYISKRKEELEQKIAGLKKVTKEKEQLIKKANENLEIVREQAQQISEEIKKTTAQKKETVTQEIKNYEQLQKVTVDSQLEMYIADEKRTAAEKIQIFQKEMEKKKEEIQLEVAKAQAELEDYKKRVEATNEDILRKKQVEENLYFYKIDLSDSAINDISILNSIRAKLSNPTILDKLIYDSYVSKPVTEMTKRVLKGNDPSGIYKITRLKTGEIYIGKSVNIKSRWQQHCKTVYNVGTIAHSILHETMKRDGVENFTFELLEEVPRDSLGEREKYWIEFYGSKKYGLNERAGG